MTRDLGMILMLGAGLTLAPSGASPEGRVDPPPAVTAFEAQQARYVEQSLEREQGLEGKVTVTPQAGTILIRIARELPLAKKDQFITGMRALKADMEKEFKRKVSILRFEFLNGGFDV